MDSTPRRRQDLLAIVSLLAGVFVLLTLLPVDVTGPVGRAVGEFLWKALGVGSVLLVLLALGSGLAAFGRLPYLSFERAAVLFAGLVVLVPYAIALVTGTESTGDYPAAYEDWSAVQRAVGLAPALLTVGITGVVGTAGAAILGLLGLSALTLYTLDWHPLRRLAAGSHPERAGVAGGGGADRWPAGRAAAGEAADGVEVGATASPRHRVTARGRGRRKGADVDLEALPPLDLLARPPREAVDAGEDEIERLGEVLIDTLGTFRVDGRVVGRTTGPVVTQYEVAPAPGVKVGRIASLADDLALAMRAQSIRIVAPIPGKAAVGVEVPNPVSRIVTLRELLETPEWDRTRATLPIALGRNLEGRPIIADLAKMPHLLIAGATGSGKSVCINTIITSLVYRYTPRELRMLMIDPKMVELAMYDALPHLRHPVVTDNKEAAQALKWVMIEMERRYELFHANGARNMEDFNRRVAEGRTLRDVRRPRSGETEAPAHSAQRPASDQEQLPLLYEEGPLPFIVIVLDELADLMMTVQSEVEKPLAILAQKARATGIHLVLATQRPSVNVITGLIKANFPSRIAFRVAQKVDSRTILDQNGAETLLGNGDMLFLPPGKSEPIRIQGAFISTDETETVTDWYREATAAREEALAGAEGERPEEQDILAVVEARELEEQAAGGTEPGAGAADRDALFREAAEVCISNQLGSTSLLQRKLRIGYGRAARIIDQLHDAGILGPPDGSKPREVLIGAEQLDEYCR